jgi:hypothetical protein
VNSPSEPSPTTSTDADSAVVRERTRRKARQRYLRAAIASVALVGIFAWVLSRGGFPLFPPPGTLSRLRALDFALFCGLMLFHMLTRFARCQFLIAPIAKVPFRRIMTINAIGMAAITFLPLRLGEMARPAMLRSKGALSAWAVTGTVGAERILDGIVFSGMLLVGLALAAPQSPLPDHVGDLPVPVWVVPKSATVGGLVFMLAFVVMAAFYWFRAPARRLTERVFGLFSVKLGKRVADIVEGLSDGLRFLTNWRYSVPYLAVTLISISGLVAAIMVLAHAVGLSELTLAQGMVVLGVLALGFTAPNAPGFFGVVQLALYAGLATYIAPAKVAREGAAMVFLYYVTHLANVSLLALIALVVELFSRPAPILSRQEGAGAA